MNGPLRTASGKIAGVVQGDTFIQHVAWGHIYRKLNAKGLDYSLYLQARMRCKYWQLVFPDGMSLRVPFEKVDKIKIERNAEAGKQIFVKLDDFNEDRPTVQGRMLIK